MVPSQRMNVANVTVTKVVVPTHGNTGEAVNIKVMLENHNSREVDGTLV